MIEPMQQLNKRPVIVTGGDKNFYFLIADLVDSIKSVAGDAFDIAVLDGGLSNDQKSQLANQVQHIIPLDWPSEPIKKRARARDFLLVNLNKARLNVLLPDYDVIIWLDADAWLQTRTALDYLMQVARQDKLAVLSEATRYQHTINDFRRRFWWHAELRNRLFKNARRMKVSYSDCWLLATKPMLNAGVYALRSSAPHWQVWFEYQLQCAQKGRSFWSDQVSLALMAYKHDLPYETLPYICNYRGPWYYDVDQKLFLEAQCPYAPVSVIHMAGHLKRDACVEASNVRLSTGQLIKIPVDYKTSHSPNFPFFDIDR